MALGNRLKVPENVNSEYALISSILSDPEILYNLKIKPEYFYKPELREVCKSILYLFSENKPIDLLSIKEQLRVNNKLDEVGGETFLDTLDKNEYNPAHAEYYLQLIQDAFSLRNIIDLGNAALETGYTPNIQVDVAKNRISDLANKIFEDQQVNKTYSLSDVVDEEWDNLHYRMENPDKIGIPTGFRELDLLTGGLKGSEVWILAARPGFGKCLGAGTRVVMLDGTLKEVEKIKVGDYLLGPDSKPRKVLNTTSGIDKIYKIIQNKGITYRVNSQHILSLKRSRNEFNQHHGDIINISIQDYLLKSDKFKNNYKGYKSSVDFAEKPVPIEPYYLGLWLGDGKSTAPSIYSGDIEIKDYLYKYAEKLNMRIHERQQQGCVEYRINGGMHLLLKSLNVYNNKHIPQIYLSNSKEFRLQLLAGLLDADGSVCGQGYEITQKNKYLATQIKFLADSLGFRTHISDKIASIKSIGFKSTVYRITIFGDTESIPVKISRKKLINSNRRVDSTMTGIKVEFDKIDTYYGFELSGDGLFLLEDFTVTHNSALALKIALNIAKQGHASLFWSFEMSRQSLAQRLVSIESGVNLTKIINAKLTQTEYNKVTDALKYIKTLPIFIESDVGASIYDIMTKTRRMKQKYNIEAIIVDYIQLMTTDDENQTQTLGVLSRNFKKIAMELDITSIILSQLNRNVEMRNDKHPVLSDLRQSGDLEQDKQKINTVLYKLSKIGKR